MILGENISSVYGSGREIQRVYSNGKLVWEKGEIDYNTTPFTVRAVDGGVSVSLGKIDRNTGKTISVDIKYSLNGGAWVKSKSTNTIKLNRNDRVSIIAADVDFCTVRGDNWWDGMKTYHRVGDIYGNIMSLIYGDDYIGQTVWTKRTIYWAEDGFFKHCDIRHAKNLILPATTLSQDAYADMFSHCVYLESAPELPAPTLVEGCYKRMFYNCGLLKRVKCFATSVKSSTSISDCISGWLAYTSSSGTFECIESFANELSPYIPSTWTVEYID